MPFTLRLTKFIAEHELFDFEDRVLVAVSGGIDSTTLLDVLVKQGYKVAIAHCNFSLRGDESDGDEQLVRNLQKVYGIRGYYIRFDTEAEAAVAGESIQMAARRLRYSWFNRLCNEECYRYIAIAHNADDVAETFFLNLTRGTGLKGLTGIKPKTGRVVRPLLFAPRKEIVEYALQNGVRYRDDSSNAKDKYARNRIRLNVIPEFKKINPAFNLTMLENIARLQLVEDLITQEVNNFKQDAIVVDGDEQHISIRKLRINRNSKLLLYEYLNFYGFNSSQIDDVFNSIEKGISGRQFFGRGYVLLRDRETLILYPDKKDVSPGFFEIFPDRESLTIPIKLAFEYFTNTHPLLIEKNRSIAMLDYEKLHFPLVLRKWQSGDEFCPLGMKGKKKLSDFFIDQKMSVNEKSNQWLLCSGSDVVWVVGRRIDDRYKISENTQTVYKISKMSD